MLKIRLAVFPSPFQDHNRRGRSGESSSRSPLIGPTQLSLPPSPKGDSSNHNDERGLGEERTTRFEDKMSRLCMRRRQVSTGNTDDCALYTEDDRVSRYLRARLEPIHACAAAVDNHGQMQQAGQSCVCTVHRISAYPREPYCPHSPDPAVHVHPRHKLCFKSVTSARNGSPGGQTSGHISGLDLGRERGRPEYRILVGPWVHLRVMSFLFSSFLLSLIFKRCQSWFFKAACLQVEYNIESG